MLTTAFNSRVRAHVLMLAVTAAHVGTVGAEMGEGSPFAESELIDIAPALSFNGTPMRIRAFQVSRPYAEMLDRSRQWFGTQRVERDIQGWRVLARKQGDSLITLRLRPAGVAGTTGTLSETPLSRVQHRRFNEFAVPGGTRVASTVTTRDADRHSRLHTFFNRQSIGANVEHFRSALHARGYRLVHDTGGDTGLAEGRSLWFSSARGDALLIVTRPGIDVGPSASTAITLNLLSGEPGGH